MHSIRSNIIDRDGAVTTAANNDWRYNKVFHAKAQFLKEETDLSGTTIQRLLVAANYPLVGKTFSTWYRYKPEVRPGTSDRDREGRKNILAINDAYLDPARRALAAIDSGECSPFSFASEAGDADVLVALVGMNTETMTQNVVDQAALLAARPHAFTISKTQARAADAWPSPPPLSTASYESC